MVDFVNAILYNFTFLVSISLIFLCLWCRPRYLLAFIFITSIIEVVNFIVHERRSFDTVANFAKLMCIWPLGMGSLVSFGLLSSKLQMKHLPWFSMYINAAVIGNIAMMFFVPIGETLRGITHRFACISLVIWLLFEMHRVKWRTVSYHNGFFQFNASPMSWVCAHALYRMIMITLPHFDTTRYLILEPASIGFMVLLNKLHGGRYASVWFGQSDTLVASTMCFTSSLIKWFVPQDSLFLLRFPETIELDLLCIGVHIAIIVVGTYKVANFYKHSKI